MSGQERDHTKLLSDGPVMLYDGECGVCNRSVSFIMQHEREPALRFASLQSQIGRDLCEKTNTPRDLSTLVVLTKEKALIKSDAVIWVASTLQKPWPLFGAMKYIPRIIRDAAYDLFAKNRARFSPAQCRLVESSERDRFLDMA